MKEKGMTQADLHRETGVSTAAISDLFSAKKNVQQSRLVPRIHRALGLEPPSSPMPSRVAAERDQLLRELIETWSELAEEDRVLLMTVARRARSRPGG